MWVKAGGCSAVAEGVESVGQQQNVLIFYIIKPLFCFRTINWTDQKTNVFMEQEFVLEDFTVHCVSLLK